MMSLKMLFHTEVWLMLLGLVWEVHTDTIGLTVTATELEINQESTYTFTLQRYINPLTNSFIFPVDSADVGSVIVVQFPSDYTTVSSETNPTCTNAADGTSLTCTVFTSNNTVVVEGYYADTSTTGNDEVRVSISSIKNPIRAMETGNFFAKIVGSGDVELDSTPLATNPSFTATLTLQAGTFSACVVSANSATVSTYSLFTFTITPLNDIPSNGELIIDVPLIWSGDVQELDSVTSASCSSLLTLAASISCSVTILTSPINLARITVTSLSASTISTQFSLTISSILTPPYINSADTIAIYSQWNDGIQIDSCEALVEDVTAIELKTITFGSEDNTEVQSQFQGRLELTLNKAFYFEDQIVLTLPTNFITNGNVSLSSSYFSSGNPTSVVGNAVSITNFPSSPRTLAENTVITIFLNDIFNFQSTEPQQIVATIYRNGNMYQQSSVQYAATEGSLTSFTISSDDQFVNAIGISQLQMNTALSIGVGSYMELTYHSTVNADDIAATSVESASLGGVKKTGVTYSVTDNVLLIESLFDVVFSSGDMIVSVGQFANPPTVQPTSYSLTIYSSSGYSILSSSYTYTAQFASLASNTITASSYTVMESSITYTIDIQSNFGFKAVAVIIPDSISVDDGFQTSCPPSFTCAIDGNNMTFVGTMAAGVHSIYWGRNNNPNSMKTTDTFQVYTYSSGWGVQQYTGYITLTMDTYAVLLSSIITPSSYQNNDNIDVTVGYTLPAATPSGTLSITFPSELDLSGSSCTPACNIIGSVVSISYTNADSDVQDAGSVIVSDVINAPSFKPVSDVVVEVVSSDGFGSVQDSVAAWTNILTSSFTTTVSNNEAYRGQQAAFTFNLAGLSGRQTYVNIKMNALFGDLTEAPTDATLVSTHEVRYDISGEGSVQLAFVLTTPEPEGPYVFQLVTYTSDDYQIGKSTSNEFLHTCSGTVCRSCEVNGDCNDCYSQDISSKYIYKPAEKTCVGDCQSGYYLDGTNCPPCDDNCLECVTDATNCTSCYNDTYLHLEYDRCVADCGDGYYANTVNNMCIQCSSPCLTCSSQVICVSCIVGYYLLNDECLQTCPSGIMVSVEVNRTCQFCDSDCLTCADFTYSCTSCNNSEGLYLDYNDCVSECSSNRFVKNGVCADCEQPCEVCYNSTTTCQTCFANGSLPLWYNYGCISMEQCTMGYFANTVNGSCDECAGECEECSSLTSCSACVDGYFLFAQECLTECPNITFQNESSRTCDDCTGCVTCSEENVCTSCEVDEFLYGGQCYSTCPDSTFPQPRDNTFGECKDCSADCPTCLNATYCLSCQPSNYLYLGVCYGVCPDGSFPSGDVCESCYETCATCTSSTNCLTCQSKYSLQNSMCVLECAVGTSHNQICYACGLNCALCDEDAAQCQYCDSGYLLYEGRCVSQCSEGTLTLDNIHCVACTSKFPNCTTCSNSQCLSCSDGQLVNGTCQPCTIGFYSRNSQCTACPAACTVCENTTYCTECADDFYIEKDYCVDTCPDNKVPNGTVCDVCVVDCAICNVSTSLCEVCVAGIYLYQGECLEKCPDDLVVSMNGTECLTPQQYYEEYSEAAKIIWFPFSIGSVVVVMIGVILKCYMGVMHLPTFLVSIIGWLQLGCWVLFGIIEYLVYVNGHQEGLKGIICVLVGVFMLIITDIVFVVFYNKYFSRDEDFLKWERNHCCINMLFVVFGGVFSFKTHRLLYSKVLDREQFSMVLSSVNKLIPISLLTVISIFVSSIPIITGASLGLYFSIATDQQFYAALDTLIVTGLMLILMLMDLRHAGNYFIDELQTQNMKRKIYEYDDEKISYEGEEMNSEKKDENMSKQNLLAEDMDFAQTTKKFHRASESREGQRQLKEDTMTVQRKNDQMLSDEQSDDPITSGIGKWALKQHDHHGYLLKYDEDNNPRRYDEHGYEVKIDEDGQHHRFDEDGHEVKIVDGKHVKYDEEGYVIGENGERYDERGFKVEREGQKIRYFDENGYEVVEDGEECWLRDKDGYKVVVEGQQHRKYNSDGYEVKVDEDGKEVFINNEGNHVRRNKEGQWETYDPTDGFILRKDATTGQLTKYDSHGFRIEKDEYGNTYRYDEAGYRAVIDHDGNIKKYDEEGFEIRIGEDGKVRKFDKDGYEMIESQNGKRQYFDENGYRVQRDFYGNPTFFDKDGYMVIIDPDTRKHRKFNSEGLELVQGEDGQSYLRDKRGKKVVQLEDGFYEKYDEVGNKIWLDEEGYEVEQDEDGNVLKYDKVGDLVDDDDEELEDDQFEGMQISQEGQKPKKQRKKRLKFKMARDFNYEQEYNKMIENQKPEIVFGSDQEDIELKEFHDIKPVKVRDLQKNYSDLKNSELIRERGKKQKESMKLSDLQEVDNTPYKNIKVRKAKQNEQIDDKNEFDDNQYVLGQQSKEKKHELKSLADVSIDKRSFDNEGVDPISQNNSSYDQLQSVDEIDPTFMKKRKRKNRHSQMSFDQGREAVETKSENNFKKGDNVKVQIPNKIYDSDEEVESLGQQQWQDDNISPYMFYKNKQFSNANTKPNDRANDGQDQEDILSDYIPQNTISIEKGKGSQEDFLTQRHMQSIEEVEDQLFDKLKSEDNRVKRTEFRLSGAPNPLVEYAKSIQNRKNAQEKMLFQGSKRYK